MDKEALLQLERLIIRWRSDAVRKRKEQDKIDRESDDEWYYYEVEAKRLEVCARELERVLKDA